MYIFQPFESFWYVRPSRPTVKWTWTISGFSTNHIISISIYNLYHDANYNYSIVLDLYMPQEMCNLRVTSCCFFLFTLFNKWATSKDTYFKGGDCKYWTIKVWQVLPSSILLRAGLDYIEKVHCSRVYRGIELHDWLQNGFFTNHGCTHGNIFR